MWTEEQTGSLGELVAAGGALLDRIGAVDDGRVAAKLEARNVRYYQGLGLVDRPVRYDGRRAIYGRRHLIQVLAIRLLQGQGYPLAQIQTAFQAQPHASFERAVLDALGEPDSPPAPLPRQATFVLAPGVQLTLDPTQVADPDGLARRIQAFLQGATP